jgi:hypothetical protein
MNDLIENLMYQSGITASGCWDKMDSYDQAAVERLVDVVARECIAICISNALDEMDSDGRTTSAKSALDIKEAFGVQ